jgi:nitroimidazol reductase NimA-like FMN-containing flavoprotein (pyridoxamine 5'-phosphate oxidase superfamily)
MSFDDELSGLTVLTSPPRTDPGAAPAHDDLGALEVDRAGLEILDRAACLRLLATGAHGRIAVNVGALPVILPVRYAVADEQLVIRVSVGSALDRATDGTVVAFQADGTEAQSAREWSVSVIGTARRLEDPSAEVIDAIRPLPRWAPELPSRLLAISTDRVTGRRTRSRA